MVMEDDGSELSWTYQTFRVAGASDKYRLTIGGGEGSGWDAMAWHNGQQFSSYDTDNDGNSIQNWCICVEHKRIKNTLCRKPARLGPAENTCCHMQILHKKDVYVANM